jgi:hypothetical protein
LTCWWLRRAEPRGLDASSSIDQLSPMSVSSHFTSHGLPVGAPLPGWTPRPWPGPAPMVGRYCTLEKLDVARHGDALIAAYEEAPDDRDWTYLFAERPTTPAAWRQFLDYNAAPRDPYYYAIIDHRTGLAVGLSAYMRIDPAHGVIEVGHVNYSPRLQRSSLRYRGPIPPDAARVPRARVSSVRVEMRSV